MKHCLPQQVLVNEGRGSNFLVSACALKQKLGSFALLLRWTGIAVGPEQSQASHQRPEYIRCFSIWFVSMRQQCTFIHLKCLIPSWACLLAALCRVVHRVSSLFQLCCFAVVSPSVCRCYSFLNLSLFLCQIALKGGRRSHLTDMHTFALDRSCNTHMQIKKINK